MLWAVLQRRTASRSLRRASSSIPAERAIPPAALLGMSADGGANAWAVLGEVVARPSQLMALVRVAAFAARGELLRVRRLLGPHFRLADVT